VKRTTTLGVKNTALETKTFKASVKAADGADGDAGIIEAIVSVFGNIDSGGDRVLKGAFSKTLDEWAAKGDPIPLIWSHQWGNPDAHIGVVLDAKETDAGLLIRGQIDLDETFGAKVFRLLKERRVTQFSFGYETRSAGWTEETDAAGNTFQIRELAELGLFEVGPTLVGMNQDTQLLEAASRPEPPAPAAPPAPPAAPGDELKTGTGDTPDTIDPDLNKRIADLLTA